MSARQLMSVLYTIVAGDGSDFDALEDKMVEPLDPTSTEGLQARKLQLMAMGAEIT